ncbi:hypothetical protein AGMMS4957_02020 [Bacteroidia bacterium]|nr:hypothetical protein AGMMS4957_02020 [Bacteroidia bacterium]
MKKRLITYLFSLLAATCLAQAQEFQPEWNVGVNGGVTLSQMRFNPIVSMGWLQQYAGGLTFRYISEKHWGLQAELNYAMRGWTEKQDSVAWFLNKYSRSLVYAEVPLMTHFYANLGKHARFVFLAGPQISFFVSEKVLECFRDLESRPRNNDYDYYDLKVERFVDYGIVGGAGFELRTGIGHFVLDGRYFFGLSDTFGNVRTEGDYFEASGNQVISIKLTYFFK